VSAAHAYWEPEPTPTLPLIYLRWDALGRCRSDAATIEAALVRLIGVNAWWAQQMRTRLRVALRRTKK
jgi:hypothetical protein